MMLTFSFYRLRTTAFITTILACTAFAAEAPQQSVVPEQYKQAVRQAEHQRLGEKESLLLSQQTTRELQATAAETQALFLSAQRSAQALQQQLTVLKDSDEGKRLASDPVALATYDNIEANPVVSLPQIKSNIDATSALINVLQLPADDPNTGYVPSADTQNKVTKLHTSATELLTMIEAQYSLLDTILQDLPADIDLTTRPTLRVVLGKYRARWQSAVVHSDMLGEALAAPDANNIMVNATRTAVLEKARAHGNEIAARTQAEIERGQIQLQATQIQDSAINHKILADANTAAANLIARTDRRSVKEATTRTVQNIASDLEQEARLAAAHKQQMIALARSPRVQSLLAPFTVHGYWQPGLSKPTYLKGPVSLEQLSSRGALDPSSQGLGALLKILRSNADRDRPRWRCSQFQARLTPSQAEDLREIQYYLTELGPVMVELGMLAK